MRNTLILMGFLAFLAVVFGVNYFFKPFAPEKQISLTQITPTPGPTQPPSSDQALEEAKAKIAGMMMVPLVITPETSAKLPDWIEKNVPAAVVLYGEGIDLPTVDDVVKNLDDAAFKKASKKTLVGTIYDGGQTQALSGEGFTPLVSWRKLCSGSLTSAKVKFATAAAELNQANINFVLSPSLDVASSASGSSYLSDSVCSGNPERVSQFGTAFIEAMDEANVLAVAKHFPGIGKLKTPLTEGFSVIQVAKKDLLPFKTLLDQASETLKDRAVLVSLVGVKESGGTACALTAECVSQVANAYDRVLIVSDDLTQKAAFYDPEKKDYIKSLPEVAYQAVLAGNHWLYFGPQASYEDLERVARFLAGRYLDEPEFKQKVDEASAMVESVRDRYNTRVNF